MKTKQTFFTALALALLFSTVAFSQVSVSVDNTVTPDESAMLTLESKTAGFLPPRMTTAQRNLIANPAHGLTIYNTTENCLQWFIGNNIWHNGCGDNTYLIFPDNTVFCESGPTAIVEVTGANGRIWMDRNLGASRAATSKTDAASYGNLHQWGRMADGHQCRSSTLYTEVVLSTDGVANFNSPGGAWDGKFITRNVAPLSVNNWVDLSVSGVDNLWQGVTGTNNPCPTGFRLPTEAELNTEKSSWVSDNSDGAFASPLKLVVSGTRERSNGNLGDIGEIGRYWSSTILGGVNRFLSFNNQNTSILDHSRSFGNAVRCIKD